MPIPLVLAERTVRQGSLAMANKEGLAAKRFHSPNHGSIRRKHGCRNRSTHMKIIRSLHLYLGCIFGPMLMFFAISGSWQAFELHPGKPGSDPRESCVRWSNVRESQRLPWNGDPKTSQPFRYLMVCMAAGVVTTTLLGIVM